jgi:hypothetical protein
MAGIKRMSGGEDMTIDQSDEWAGMVKISKEQLITVLNDLIKTIEADDTFYGYLKFDAMAPELQRNEFMLSAAYRIGCAEGQGGWRLYG